MVADDDDDDREDNDDEDEKPAAKPKPKPVAKAKPKAEPVDENIALMREIRDLVKASHERQDRYLWLLLPVIAILLVIAIFQAVKL